MKKITHAKQIILFVCIYLIIVSGCQTQLQKGISDLFVADSSQEVLQMPRVHTERTDLLDEDQWLADDDAESHINIHDKKALFMNRDTLRLFVVGALVAGLAVLFAYVAAQVYHCSSCPTRGLSCMLEYIFRSDGQKDNISFSF